MICKLGGQNSIYPSTYIYRKFTAYPDQLCRVDLKLSDAAGMSFQRVRSGLSKLVNRLQVSRKHMRMLVIFGRDILLDGLGKCDIVSPAKRQDEHVA